MARSNTVAVVIVNYNGFEYSRECIDSIRKVEYPDCAIVFVDNGSPDGSGEAIHNLYKDKIVYLSLAKNLGVTGGNNAGIEYALTHDCKYVLFLNNDTLVDAHFLDSLVQTSQASGDALVVPKIVCYFDQQRLDHWVGPDFNWWTGMPQNYQQYPYAAPELNRRSEIKVASTCCLLTPVSVIRAIGGMDENYFMYYDDADFTLRAARAGYRLLYEPESIIYHKCNMTTRNLQPAYFEFYLINRNFFYFYNKLCNRPLIKYAFLAKSILRLMWHFAKSYTERNPIKRQVVELVIKDVLAKRMGPPPRVAPFVKTPQATVQTSA